MSAREKIITAMQDGHLTAEWLTESLVGWMSEDEAQEYINDAESGELRFIDDL